MFFISLSAPCQHPASLALRQQQTTGGASVGWERPARVGGGIILTAPSLGYPTDWFSPSALFIFFTEILPEQALEVEPWFLVVPEHVYHPRGHM